MLLFMHYLERMISRWKIKAFTESLDKLVIDLSMENTEKADYNPPDDPSRYELASSVPLCVRDRRALCDDDDDVTVSDALGNHRFLNLFFRSFANQTSRRGLLVIIS